MKSKADVGIMNDTLPFFSVSIASEDIGKDMFPNPERQ
jgi:hypothetical protein